VRLLAASNRDMEKEVAQGRFREDLYYRINVMSLQLPPLRERAGDIPLLVKRLLGDAWVVEPDAMQALESYRWPGNVRQLFNALERAQIMSENHRIRLHDLPREVVSSTHSKPSLQMAATVADGDRLSDIQRNHILEILQRERGNKARAARALGINRRSLYRLLEKYEIGEAHTPCPTENLGETTA
jgi:DNA-binding NtrC family response regulator